MAHREGILISEGRFEMDDFVWKVKIVRRAANTHDIEVLARNPDGTFYSGGLSGVLSEDIQEGVSELVQEAHSFDKVAKNKALVARSK